LINIIHATILQFLKSCQILLPYSLLPVLQRTNHNPAFLPLIR